MNSVVTVVGRIFTVFIYSILHRTLQGPCQLGSESAGVEIRGIDPFDSPAMPLVLSEKYV